MISRALLVSTLAFFAFVVAPAVALAGPRSGGSFGGRSGFRSGGSSFSRSYSGGRRSYGGGSNFVFLPSFGGWGFGGYGMGGGGGMGFLGTLMMLGIVGVGTVLVVRSLRQAQRRYSGGGGGWPFGSDDGDEADSRPDRAYVYKIQLGLGRSARDIQNRLARFAGEGDTASEAGLAQLLHQTGLELLREKDSIRYGFIDASGPMSLTNGETKMNAAALSERSRFSVERVRGADGKVRRADQAATESADALEYLVVTLVVATRTPLLEAKALADRGDLELVLGELGAVPPQGLLGLEVVWTPADPQDSLTQSDMMTSYPEMRSL